MAHRWTQWTVKGSYVLPALSRCSSTAIEANSAALADVTPSMVAAEFQRASPQVRTVRGVCVPPRHRQAMEVLNRSRGTICIVPFRCRPAIRRPPWPLLLPIRGRRARRMHEEPFR